MKEGGFMEHRDMEALVSFERIGGRYELAVFVDVDEQSVNQRPAIRL